MACDFLGRRSVSSVRRRDIVGARKRDGAWKADDFLLRSYETSLQRARSKSVRDVATVVHVLTNKAIGTAGLRLQESQIRDYGTERSLRTDVILVESRKRKRLPAQYFG